MTSESTEDSETIAQVFKDGKSTNKNNNNRVKLQALQHALLQQQLTGTKSGDKASQVRVLKLNVVLGVVYRI